MITLIFAFACLILSCGGRVVESPAPPPDPLELQHRLNHALDSLDSVRAICQAPEGCTCRGYAVKCDDQPLPGFP